MCYPCEWPSDTRAFTAIIQGDATLEAHSFYTQLAVGGRLIDGTPLASATVGGRGWAGTLDPATNIRWQQGVTTGPDRFPFQDWAHFEDLANRMQNATSIGRNGQSVPGGHGEFSIYVIDQGVMGGTYNGYHFTPSGRTVQGENQGRTLVVFTNTGTVTLQATSGGGRQFGPSVLAPFASVVLDGGANGGIGFVDGFVISRSLGSVDGYPVQLHGDAYIGPLVCVPSPACDPPAAPPPPARTIASGTSSNLVGDAGNVRQQELTVKHVKGTDLHKEAPAAAASSADKSSSHVSLVTLALLATGIVWSARKWRQQAGVPLPPSIQQGQASKKYAKVAEEHGALQVVTGTSQSQS